MERADLPGAAGLRDAHGRARSRLAGLFLRVVGDRFGAAIFSGALLFYAVYWQAGIVIVDTYAVANGLVALGDGHLAVETARFGSGLDTPGMHLVDGRYYARNYGQLVAALPLYGLLIAVDAAVELRVAIAAAWSLSAVWFSSVLATIRDDRRLLTAGGVAALGLFFLNLRAPTPIPDGRIPVLALQLLSTIAAALAGVLVYRLVGLRQSRRPAVVAGAVTAVASPVAFWAAIPKRHTLTTALVLAVTYLFFRSRDADRAGDRDPTTLRAAMYALVGLFTWVHAPVGLTLFLSVLVVDVPTAPRTDLRSLAVVGTAFLVSLVPFFVTNYLISGNPVVPPRLLPDARGGVGPGAGGTPVIGGGSATAGGGTEPWFVAVVPGALDLVVDMGVAVLGTYWRGVVTLLDHPMQLVHVVVVSAGDVPGVSADSVEQASNLSMLEAAPALGAALVVPVAALFDRLRSRALPVPRPTDLVVLVFSVLLVLVYLPRLPVFGQITVRYLTPLYPLGIYAVCKNDRFARALRARTADAGYAYEAVVLLWPPLLFGAVFRFGWDEARTFRALSVVGLAVSLLLVGVAAVTARSGRAERPFAVTFGAAAGLGTVFVAVSLLVLFHYGIHVLPVVQTATELLRRVLVRMTV